MGETTAIEWTGHTWNPWQGCRKVSPGCAHCYMYREKKRYGQKPDVIVRSKPPTFNAPLKWKDPAYVFACSWSDFFIEEADPWRAEAWDIIRRSPHLTFQIPTKRPERILRCLPPDWGNGWKNVWLLASVENQPAAEKRVPELLRVPAVIHGISAEPLIAGINLRDLPWNGPDHIDALTGATFARALDGSLLLRRATAPSLDWVIVGGESGPFARPMHPGWARSLLTQCADAKVPFFFKQWGEWAPTERMVGYCRRLDAGTITEMPRKGDAPPFIVAVPQGANDAAAEVELLERIGRERAGSVLDGSSWKQFPVIPPATRTT